MDSDSNSELRQRRSPAPWFLLLAVLLLVVAGVTTLLRSRAVTRNHPPEIEDPDQPVDALRAELSLDSRGRLIAELTPLHAEPSHDAFEADSLRRRLNLADGRPWRLRLRWDAPASSGGSSGSIGDDLERGGREVLGLGALEVVVGDQVVARSLDLPESASAPVDPVRTLLSSPRGALGPGEAVDVVLWGSGAHGRAQLRGLTMASGALPLDLEPTTLARAELELPITHEVRGDEIVREGKKAGASASQRGARARSASDG